MPVAVGDVAAAPAPVAERRCLLLFCVGAVCVLNTWLFSAGVAALVVARATCGMRCPDVLVVAAMSLAVAALAIALACSIAMLLLSHYLLDAGARGHMVRRPNSTASDFVNSIGFVRVFLSSLNASCFRLV